MLQSNKNYNLEKRKDEITSTIIDSVCSLASEAGPDMYSSYDPNERMGENGREENGREEDGRVEIKEVNSNYIFTFVEQLDGTGVCGLVHTILYSVHNSV